jgi:bacteriocin-like protein
MMQENRVEFVIELTDDELKEVSGGSGTASFSFTSSATGGNSNAVTGTLNLATTFTSAASSGSFSASST